ncbi:RpoE family DNA-directed RNA polymerase sigma subunit [Rhodopirellula maiorica SM1]|uniref:RpoE family DNA-directed RNA polymerase sigma subunit n=2 Tax=Novipirellula TaxID=2795426 RepID=M5RRH7_9BACT|nr:RpoE family DNA-directed RNA polymerase sigma subunit [Rhodopirellula maiorica SM1]
MWAEVSPRLDIETVVLDECVLKLSDRQQTLVRLRYSEELTSGEIAERLSLTAANVRKILDRTRDALRRCVEANLRPTGDAR